VPLCADSKLYYERCCPYSLIDGELTSTVSDAGDVDIDQQVSDADTDQLILTDDSKSVFRINVTKRLQLTFIAENFIYSLLWSISTGFGTICS